MSDLIVCTAGEALQRHGTGRRKRIRLYNVYNLHDVAHLLHDIAYFTVFAANRL
jgi:hypothetical protein